MANASPALVGLLLRRFALRHWRFAPRQSLLLVLILAMGVAVFVAVRLANRAAVSSFTHFTDTLTGRSDWIIQAPAGPLPESVLPELRAALGTEPVHILPVVEASASRPALPGENADKFGRPAYTVLGVDLLGLANLARDQDRSFFGQQVRAQNTDGGAGSGAAAKEAPRDLWSYFNGPPQLWISDAFAAEPPTEVELVFDESIRRIHVAGVIPSAPDAPRAPATLMIMDLPQLQRITGKVGRVDRVEFIVEPGPRLDERRTALREKLEALSHQGERWSVTSPGARRESAEMMTRAFRLNLTILSLIALLVGLYLIFQALDGAVVRRRPEIAILRSLGVEAGTIYRVWLLESAVLGLAGGALGLLLGWAGAQVSVRAVGQTVNALYYATTVASADLTLAEIGLGLSLGTVAALIAGWWPARAAAQTPPAQVLQRSAAPAPGNAVFASAPLGIACVLAGIACTWVPAWRFEGGGRFPVAGYAAAFLWIFGAGILCGFLLPALAGALRAIGRRLAPARVALSHLRRPSGRHRLAAAALLCAIGMTAGMAILVGSFEVTMQGWVKRTLQADLYIASSGAQSASARNFLSTAAVDAMAAHPAVARSSRLVAYEITLDGLSTLLSGGDQSLAASRVDLPWVQAPKDGAVFDADHNAGLVLVSEAFSERFRKRRGDTFALPTPSGPQPVTIAGVYADYGNERGSILADRRHVTRWFGQDNVSNLAVFVKDGVEAEALREEWVREYPGLTVYTNSRLRSEILRIFRQTFSITYALEIVGVLVAVVGLALTLVSVLLDRREELTTLRALGFRRREIALATAIEGASIALAAVLGGLVLSLALGWLLIHVINKQSFGWTLSFALPWGQLAALAATICATGWGVSYAVGLWGAALPADQEE